MKDETLLKLVGWFILLCVVGSVVCVILGVIKAAIQALVIVAAVLLFIALGCSVIYWRIKARHK